jgi:hypothetical protein
MRNTLRGMCALLAFVCCASARAAAPPRTDPRLLEIRREQLCVTNGEVSALPDGRLAIDTPSSRAVMRIATVQHAEIRFRYLGASRDSKPLASGEMRRQIGLKLRAQDTCNLLYAMWHIEPDSRIAVSVKRNPGKHTHEECGAKGYVNIKPRANTPVPKVFPGETHRLRAELHGTELTVLADGRVVWEGAVENALLDFEGPVGFRTDNARFEFEYFVAESEPGAPHGNEKLTRCLSSVGD